MCHVKFRGRRSKNGRCHLLLWSWCLSPAGALGWLGRLWRISWECSMHWHLAFYSISLHFIGFHNILQHFTSFCMHFLCICKAISISFFFSETIWRISKCVNWVKQISNYDTFFDFGVTFDILGCCHFWRLFVSVFVCYGLTRSCFFSLLCLVIFAVLRLNKLLDSVVQIS